MIDCFAFLFASWNPEKFFPPSLFLISSPTSSFYFCELVLLQTRNLGLVGTEISSGSALKLI